jgi:hypothetical protein
VRNSFKREYARILITGLLDSVIRVFRQAIPSAAGQTDEKVVDWLIWRFVDLAYQKEWCPSGLCQYR